MGIAKIKPQGPGNNIHTQRGYPSTLLQNELLYEEKLLLQKAPLDFFDDDQLEVGSECVVVGGHTCNIPYELYDLPDLKKILALETWNNCLTDDERLSLAAYLPDIDQETFWILMKELLGGDVMFFKSPLEKFFTGLKGGFYNPQVSRLRESLQFFQRREYYHYLRSYHESMTRKFLDMRKLWNKHQPNSSVEERIHVWNNQKLYKPILLVDLNAYPEDDALNKSDKIKEIVPLPKKKKRLNDSHKPDVTPNVAWNNKPKPKGVLKIKSVEKNSIPNNILQPYTAETMEPPKRVPKGVLKLKPKYGSTDQPVARKTPEIFSADLLSIHEPRISSKYVLQQNGHRTSEKLPSLYQIEKDGSANRNLELTHNRQREGLLTIDAASLDSSQKCEAENIIKATRSEDASELCPGTFPLKFSPKPRNYSHESGEPGKQHGRKGFEKPLKAQKGSFSYITSKPPRFDTFHAGTETHHDKWLNNLNIEANLISSDNADVFNNELQGQTDGIARAYSCMDDSRYGNDIISPITYKRKKQSTKLNHVEPLKQQPSVANADSANFSGMQNAKPKSIKIKFKGLPG